LGKRGAAGGGALRRSQLGVRGGSVSGWEIIYRKGREGREGQSLFTTENAENTENKIWGSSSVCSVLSVVK